MKHWKRTLSILIIFALSLGIFVGCTPQGGIDASGTHSDSHSQSSKSTDSAVSSDASFDTSTDSAVSSDATSNNPTDSTPSIDEVEVTKEYTTLTLEDDFPVGQLQVNMNPNNALGDYRLENFSEVNCLGVLDSIRVDDATSRFVIVALTDLSKESTLSAIKTLEQRNDVLSVKPVTEEYMDSLVKEQFAFREFVEKNYEFIPGEILITLYPSASRKTYTEADFSEVNCIQLKQKFYPTRNCYYMTVFLEDKTEEGTIAAAEKLTERDDVRAIEFNFHLSLDSATTDQVPSDITPPGSESWAIERIQLPHAWDSTTGSANVTVGVIDTGIDATHPDLYGQVSTTLSKCFPDETQSALVDINGHGTHVAGIIGGKANNGGMVGVCWNVTLVSLRISVANNSEGYAVMDDDDLIEAIDYAERNGIDILNLSASGFLCTPRLEDVLEDYSGLFVCSAGNTNTDLDTTNRYPGSYQSANMIVVGASSQTNGRWVDEEPELDESGNVIDPGIGSNYGTTEVDIFAPGESIYSCLPGNRYAFLSGTSMATPYVAGVAALVLSVSPNISTKNLKSLIFNYATPYSALSGYCETGKLLNAYRVLDTIAHAHHYTMVTDSVNSTQHIAYCECGVYTLQNHSFTESSTSTGSSQHRAYCKCGDYITLNHTYTHHYDYMSVGYHKAYCACGVYTSEAHAYTDSGSTRTCSKCGHTAELNNVEPKPETE